MSTFAPVDPLWSEGKGLDAWGQARQLLPEDCPWWLLMWYIRLQNVPLN